MRVRFSGKIILPILVVFVAFVLAMPRTKRFTMDYRKGSPWNHETLIAQFDFPLLKTESQMLEERKNSLKSVPCYKFSTEVMDHNVALAGNLPVDPSVKIPFVSTLRSLYERGIVEDGFKPSGYVYLQRNKRAERVPVRELLRVSEAINELPIDSTLAAAEAYNLVKANVLFDQQLTDLIYSENDRVVSTTEGYVYSGTLIVSEGEIVTADIEQMLDSYKKEYDLNMGYANSGFWNWVGNILIAMTLIALLLWVIYFTNVNLFNESARFSYIMLIVLIAALSAIIVGRINEDYLYMVPFTLTALYLQAFFRNRVIIGVYIVSLIPLLLFAQDGVALFVMYLLAGLVSVYAFKYFNRGWQQFVTALIAFGVLMIVYFGFHFAGLLHDKGWITVLRLFMSSMLTVAGYPLIFLFERIFNLVSSSRLIELCDSSNKLLRTLEQKAPGTFQHSRQVMNMVEVAARAIGADEFLLKAGAMYHDIGKIQNPLCFVENQAILSESEKDKYHKSLSPIQSAQDIIHHISDGEEIANKHRLPAVLVDLIKTHHGTTLVSYFYNEHLKLGGSPEDIDEFRYPGPKPTTTEQVILMLCDSIEAASRTLKEHSAKAFNECVESIVEAKMAEGQLQNCEISISELGTVKSVLKNYLAQVHHERIEYPKRNKIKHQ